MDITNNPGGEMNVLAKEYSDKDKIVIIKARQMGMPITVLGNLLRKV